MDNIYLKKAITYFVIGGLLICLPEFLMLGSVATYSNSTLGAPHFSQIATITTGHTGISAIMEIINTTCNLLGVGFLVKSIMAFKKYDENLTQENASFLISNIKEKIKNSFAPLSIKQKLKNFFIPKKNIQASMPILNMAIASVLAGLPEFLRPDVHLMWYDDLSATMVQSSPSSTAFSILSLLSYVISIGFGVKSALQWKAYNEFHMANELEQSGWEITPVVSEEVYENIIFDNYELNQLVDAIKEKLDYLKNNSHVAKDVESKVMIKKTETDYLRRIHRNYMDVPVKKRGEKGIEDSPYDLTFNQLSLLLQALDQIEDKIVQHIVIDQKATQIILKEKVANM